MNHKKKGDRAQINKIRNKKGQVTTDNTEIQRIIRDYCQSIKWTTWKKGTNSQKIITFQS